MAQCLLVLILFAVEIDSHCYLVSSNFLILWFNEFYAYIYQNIALVVIG